MSGVLRRALGVLTTAGLVSCQLVGGYEGFEASTPETEPEPERPHRCSGLPRAKADEKGLATMVLIEADEDRCFWIDRTEVTVATYAAYLAHLAETGAAPDLDPARCGWKEELSDPVGSTNDHCAEESVAESGGPFSSVQPIRCVDWCDADALCKWSKKHLCHAAVAQQNLGWEVPRNVDDWSAACSGSEGSPLPYGATADETKCNIGDTRATCIGSGAQERACFPAVADAFPECGFEGGPLNMIGNVSEWTAVCQGAGIAEEPCRVRGGWYGSGLERETCFSQFETVPRGARSPHVGVRCCAEITPQEEASLAR